MAKVKSSGLRNYVGRLGGSVYYMLNGQNIAREKAAEVSNPRTASQMRQRMQWANIVAMYKCLQPYLGKKAWQNKRATWSDYNAFMSANLGADPVYLTKDMVQNGHAFLAPYKVTEGSLQKVVLNYDAEEDVHIPEISLGNFDILAETTIAELAAAIITNNSAWKAGDQLGIIVVQNGREYRPNVCAVEIILDENDTRPLLEVTGTDDMLLESSDGKLLINWAVLPNPTQGIECACAVIQSRTIAGKTSVSTQSLVLNTAALGKYNSLRTEDAFNEARESYGMPSEVWLDATYQYGSEPVVTPGRITAIEGQYQGDDTGAIGNFTINPGGRNTFMVSDLSAPDNRTYVTIATNKTLPDGSDYCICFVPNGQSTPTAVSHVATGTGATSLSRVWFDRTNAAAIAGRAGYFYLVESDVWEPELVVAIMSVTE